VFIEDKFILCNELVNKMGIHPSNVSRLMKMFRETGDYYTIQKFDGCSVINRESKKLPRSFAEAIKNNEFTSMYNKLPVTHTKSYIGVTKSQLLKGGMIDGEITVAGKRLYVFKDEIVKLIGSHIPYVLDYNETIKCKDKGLIKDYIKMTSNRYFVWY